ncbi:MAG: GNAT family N-acetyltransferase [Candidatus Brocadiaceae bacterium]|nr:GNAT family N-acetyltransferase [Candidatus Brocadiaceae bacterium]
MGAAPELQVVAPDPKVHLPEMYEMCAKVFSKPERHATFLEWCRNAYIGNSHYDWNTATIGILDGRIVTHYGIWGYVMRIGSARIRKTGVGLVATHPDYRKRGLMTLTANRSMELMRENGYDMSTVTGIAHYYDRFGYVPAWNVTDYSVEAHHLPDEKPGVRIRTFEPGHHADLAKLYNRRNARRTCTVMRPTFLKNQRPGQWFGYRWNDTDGKLAGYVIVSKEKSTLRALDWAGNDADTFAVLCSLVRKHGSEILAFKGMHYDDPLRTRVIGQFCATATTRYRSTGGPMITTINLASTLTKLAGEFSRRLKDSSAADWQGSLVIADANEKATLLIDRSKVEVGPPARTKHSISGGNHIARLLIGSDEPGEVVKDAGMRLMGDARRLVEVLFPNNHPTQGQWDHV